MRMFLEPPLPPLSFGVQVYAVVLLVVRTENHADVKFLDHIVLGLCFLEVSESPSPPPRFTRSSEHTHLQQPEHSRNLSSNETALSLYQSMRRLCGSMHEVLPTPKPPQGLEAPS